MLWQKPQMLPTWPVVGSITQHALFTASLAEVAVRSTDSGLMLAAKAAVNGIRSIMPTEVDDASEFEMSVASQLSWQCGASGVAIPLLSILQFSTDSELTASVSELLANLEQQALTAIARMGAEPILDFSLFGGLSGIIEFLLSASQTAGSEAARKMAEAIGRAGLEQIVQADRIWPCGMLDSVEPLTMMPGLAGIGHTYLRLHYPTIPSIYDTAMPHLKQADINMARSEKNVPFTH